MPAREEKANVPQTHLQRLFIFALMWSFGGLLELDERAKLQTFLLQHEAQLDFPTLADNETIFEYVVDAEGLSPADAGSQRGASSDVDHELRSDKLKTYSVQRTCTEIHFCAALKYISVLHLIRHIHLRLYVPKIFRNNSETLLKHARCSFFFSFFFFFFFLLDKKCEAAGKKCVAGHLADYIPGETLAPFCSIHQPCSLVLVLRVAT